MQTLGLSDSTPRTESRIKALLWPTIRNEADLEYVSQQGFWICSIIALASAILGIIGGSIAGGIVEATFYFLAGTGVRERSKLAAVVVFVVYFMSAFINGSGGLGIARIIFSGVLLANIRGIWLSSNWTGSSEPEPRFSETFLDWFSSSLPSLLWPKVKYLFYVLAMLMLLVLAFMLFGPKNYPMP